MSANRERLLVAALLSATSIACSSTAILERSVGRVILESDRYPYGAHHVSTAIEREYENVRGLPVSERMRFFWSVMMNVSLDASYSVEFAELIARDCPEQYQSKLVQFIEEMEHEGGLPPAEPQTSTAKRMLETLRLLRPRSG